MPKFAKPFKDAVRSLTQRDLLPTKMGADDIKQIGQDIRARSFFSARNTNDTLLNETKNRVLKILKGETDIDTAKAELREIIDRIGYKPKRGKEETIEDLGSDQRLQLVVQTNVDIAKGFGETMAGLTDEAIDSHPAQELYRREDRDEERDWEHRFRIAGLSTGLSDGWKVEGGRMVALKTHPIWDALGSSTFPDSLGNSWPPFAFNSGMWTKDVPKTTALRLGVIDPGQEVQPKIPKYSEALLGLA